MSLMTSIILAGGRSARLGREKALEPIGGKLLIQHVIASLSLLGNDIIIVTSGGGGLPELGIRMVVDIYPGKGPLGGIYTGLKSSLSQYNLVVACDMPLLNIALLRYIIEQSPGFDVVLPRIGGKVEPLHAVYSRDCLPAIEAALSQNRLQIRRVFEKVRVRQINEEEISRFDPEHLSFFNINSPSDLERARAILKIESSPRA